MKYTQEELDYNLWVGNPVYCYRCNKMMDHTFPHLLIDNCLYCGDCCFIEGFIDDKTYVKECLYFMSVLPNLRATVKDGKIYVTYGKKNFEFERTDKEIRHSPEYNEWRKKVFERDKYTCQVCGRIGGELNAHHKKSFKKYIKQRFSLKNGITLCVDCHKKVHKGEIDGLYTN